MRDYEACKGHIANGAGPGTDLNRQRLNWLSCKKIEIFPSLGISTLPSNQTIQAKLTNAVSHIKARRHSLKKRLKQ